MKILLRILAGLGVLIVLLLVIALFVNKEYTFKKEIVINRPKNEVFGYVKYLKNMDHYNKWVRMDTTMKKEFRGTDGTVGFVYAWDGNDQAGKGEQEIKTIRENEKMDIDIRFIKPFEGLMQTQVLTQDAGVNQTKVIWTSSGKSAYPMNITNLFIDNILGNDLAESLKMLKSNLEK